MHRLDADRLNSRLRQTRAEVIREAAERLLARDGCGEFTTSKLANVVGVGKGTLYNHLPSKRSWVEAVVAARSDEFVQNVLRESNSADWRDQLIGLVNSMVRAVETPSEDRLGLPCCLSRAPCPYAGWVAIDTLIAELIRKGTEAGELSNGADAGWLSRLLKFLIVASVAKGTETPEIRKQRLQFVAQAYLYAMIRIPARQT
jgi:AcrR family transcriptional regulator